MATAKEKFLKAYANTPPPLRTEIIVIIDGKTYSWDAAFFEVKNDSSLSRKILNMLSAMQII